IAKTSDLLSFSPTYKILYSTFFPPSSISTSSPEYFPNTTTSPTLRPSLTMSSPLPTATILPWAFFSFSAEAGNTMPDLVTSSLADLVTSQQGLALISAERRLAQFGKNEISDKTPSIWRLVGRQFKSPFIYLLLAAVVLSMVLGEGVDSILILLFIVLNAALG